MNLRHKGSRLAGSSRGPSTQDLLQPLLPSDIVVLVMGVSGAGRSTFVNALLPKNATTRMAIGDKDSLDPCTMTAECVILDSKGLGAMLGRKTEHRLVLVDTPGFDAGNTLDSEGVLKEIVDWSRSRLPNGQPCRGGAIFMHNIASDRFHGQQDFTSLGQVFNSPSASPRLVVVTSNWGVLGGDESESRHRLLAKRFKQAVFHRFRDDGDAWVIMKQFLPQIERGAMLDFGKEFGDIQARKRASEKQYKKKRSRLSSFFKSLMFWKS